MTGAARSAAAASKTVGARSVRRSDRWAGTPEADVLAVVGDARVGGLAEHLRRGAII
jgi:hypothetical protein